MFELRGRLTRLLLDVSEELEEVLGILLKHLLGAYQTKLSHFIEVGQALNLFVFLLEKHLYEEHLTLLLDQVPAILSVFRPFNWHIKTSILGYIDFISDIRVDSKRSWLNVSFAELAKAALTRRSILLPNLQFLVLLALSFLPGTLFVLERENAIVTWVCKRIRMLLKAKQ